MAEGMKPVVPVACHKSVIVRKIKAFRERTCFVERYGEKDPHTHTAVVLHPRNAAVQHIEPADQSAVSVTS